MTEDFFNTTGDLYENYKAGLIWLGILIGLIIVIIDRQKKKRNKRYIRIRNREAIILPMKPDINWPMTICSVIFGGFGLIAFVIDLSNSSIDSDSWSILGWTVVIFGLFAIDSLRRLLLQFTENEIVFNYVHYKASEIRKIELWDDLIFVVLKSGQEKKIWLRFRAKHYKTALEVIESIYQFCQKRGIPIQNQFAIDIRENEVFNPGLIK